MYAVQFDAIHRVRSLLICLLVGCDYWYNYFACQQDARCSLKLDKKKHTIFSRNMWSHTGWPINCDTKSFLFVTISIPFSVFNWYQLYFFRSVQIVFTSQFCLRHIFSGNFSRFFYVWIWKLEKYKEFFYSDKLFFEAIPFGPQPNTIWLSDETCLCWYFFSVINYARFDRFRHVSI